MGSENMRSCVCRLATLTLGLAVMAMYLSSSAYVWRDFSIAVQYRNKILFPIKSG